MKVFKNNFTIFLPVRNGMPFIKDAVNSILNQSYKSFNLHVLDNNSSDGTYEWIKSIADERIILQQSKIDLSIEESWQRILYCDKEEFMTMFASDDILHKDFLFEINSLINKDPQATLYQTGGEFINSKGKKIRDCYPVKDIEKIKDYLSDRYDFKKDVSGTGYVMRSNDYNSIGGIPIVEKLSFSDDMLWIKLMEKSHKRFLDKNLYKIRIHQKSESSTPPRNWRPFLNALINFNDFLKIYENDKNNYLDNIKTKKEDFLSKYIQNIYILAILHYAPKKISEVNKLEIENAFNRLVNNRARSVYDSNKIKLVNLIMKTPMRYMIIYMWNIFLYFKNRD